MKLDGYGSMLKETIVWMRLKVTLKFAKDVLNLQ